MNTASKIAIGVGIASGALLAAWLLTGNRKAKTKRFIANSAASLKRNTQKSTKLPVSDSDSLYV